MREICASGSVGGEGGNVLAYPAKVLRTKCGFRWWLIAAPKPRRFLLLVAVGKVALQAKDFGVDVLVRLNLGYRRAVIGSNVRFRFAFAHLVVPRSVWPKPRLSMRWRADHSRAMRRRPAPFKEDDFSDSGEL